MGRPRSQSRIQTALSSGGAGPASLCPQRCPEPGGGSAPGCGSTSLPTAPLWTVGSRGARKGSCPLANHRRDSYCPSCRIGAERRGGRHLAQPIVAPVCGRDALTGLRVACRSHRVASPRACVLEVVPDSRWSTARDLRLEQAMTPYRIREATLEDVPGIRELFARAYGAELPEEEWRWKFERNPDGW